MRGRWQERCNGIDIWWTWDGYAVQRHDHYGKWRVVRPDGALLQRRYFGGVRTYESSEYAKAAAVLHRARNPGIKSKEE